MTAGPRVPSDVPRWTTGLAQATSVELGKAASPRAGRWLLIAAAVLGLLSALIVAFTAPGQDRTFGLTSFFVQSTISLPLPLVSVLLMTRDFGRRALSRTLAPIVPIGRTVAAKLFASAIIAIGAAGYGMVLSVLATSLPPTTAEGQWEGAGMIIFGSALVQLIAQLCGAGFGLLLRSSAAAIVADVVVPLGLWIVSGSVPGLHALQAWLTRFGGESAIRPHECATLGSSWRCRARVGRRTQRCWGPPAPSPDTGIASVRSWHVNPKQTRPR